MNNLLLPKNGKLLIALLVFFVVFGLIFDPWSSFYLALAFAGVLVAYRLMQQKKRTVKRKVAKKGVKKTKRARRK